MSAGPAPTENAGSTAWSTTGRDRPALRAFAVSLPLLAVNVGLLLVFDLAHHLALTLTLLGIAFLGLLGAARWLESAKEKMAASGKAILLAAILLRLPLLPLPPTLSDDVLRYLWDGKVAAAGLNPYALPPAADRLSPLRDETWRRLPHTQVPTVYPPLSVAAFSIASRVPFPLVAWKSMTTAADLLACWLLLGVARRLGVPLGRTVWYAWNPLVTLEVAGMGHVDALGVTAVVGVVLCLLSKPPRRLGGLGSTAVWAAAGALAKLVPLAVFPMWARQSRRPWRFLGLAGGLVALGLAPVVAACRGIPPGLVAYGVSWEYDGPVYEPLWRVLDEAGAAPALAQGLDRYKAWSKNWWGVNFLYPYLYPRFLAKVLLAAGMGAIVLASLRWRDPVAGTGRLFGALLLLSATVYPWYLLWVLPWAALRRHTAWLALSALILLSYLPEIPGVVLWPWVYLGIWVPFGVLMVVGPVAAPSSQTPHHPGPLLPSPSPRPGEEGEQQGRPA